MGFIEPCFEVLGHCRGRNCHVFPLRPEPTLQQSCFCSFLVNVAGWAHAIHDLKEGDGGDMVLFMESRIFAKSVHCEPNIIKFRGGKPHAQSTVKHMLFRSIISVRGGEIVLPWPFWLEWFFPGHFGSSRFGSKAFREISDASPPSKGEALLFEGGRSELACDPKMQVWGYDFQQILGGCPG